MTYWENFYKNGNVPQNPSSFAKFSLPFIKGDLVDLGCGNGRDLRYFLYKKIKVVGVDNSFTGANIKTEDIWSYTNKYKSPDNVYTRFFWHSIKRKDRLKILDWTKNMLFIEARTTDDKDRLKIFPSHDRLFVDVAELVNDLKGGGFQIIRLEEGTGFSPYKKEDPHLVRVVAKKQ